MATRPFPYHDTVLRILRTVAHHPGSTPEEVARRAFSAADPYAGMACASRILRDMRENKLLKRGYVVFCFTGRRRGKRSVNYTYYVSRSGFEVLKCDEQWTNN